MYTEGTFEIEATFEIECTFEMEGTFEAARHQIPHLNMSDRVCSRRTDRW